MQTWVPTSVWPSNLHLVTYILLKHLFITLCCFAFCVFSNFPVLNIIQSLTLFCYFFNLLESYFTSSILHFMHGLNH